MRKRQYIIYNAVQKLNRNSICIQILAEFPGTHFEFSPNHPTRKLR